MSQEPLHLGPVVTHSEGDEKRVHLANGKNFLMFLCYLCGRSNLHKRWNAMRIEVLGEALILVVHMHGGSHDMPFNIFFGQFNPPPCKRNAQDL